MKHFNFKSGECSVSANDQDSQALFFRYEGDESIVRLLMIADAMKRIGRPLRKLTIPYFPGSRQDRVCNYGEAFSLKVYANLINSLGLEEVTIFDPHSEVTPALIENCRVIDNSVFVMRAMCRYGVTSYNQLPLVSPDAGSNKKIFGLAKRLEGPEVIRADKVRDVRDGKIIGTEVFADDLSGKTLWVVDDVISGGRTFIELAKKLKEKGAAKVLLVVSHDEGVCSEQLLKDSGIDQMFTTNSIKSDLTSSDFRVVFDIKEFV